MSTTDSLQHDIARLARLCWIFGGSIKSRFCELSEILGVAPFAVGPSWLLGVAIGQLWCFLFDILRTIWQLGTPWVTILASRGYFGGPWKKQEGHEGVQNQIFIGFGSFFGLCFDSFGAPRLEI